MDKLIMKPEQIEMLNAIDNEECFIDINAKRRSGKTTAQAYYCILQALDVQHSIIDYLCSSDLHVDSLIKDVFPSIIDGLPCKLQPRWNKYNNRLVFNNGSVIRIFNSSKNITDKLSSAMSDLCFIDEGQDHYNLPNIIDSINTDKLVVISTKDEV